MNKFLLLLLLIFQACAAQIVKLENEYYINYFDTIKKESLYTKYELNYTGINPHYGRNILRKDARVCKQCQIKDSDFKLFAPFDRGHLVPIIDFTYSLDAIKYVNVFTNILPQAKNMNRGIWRELEGYINYLHFNQGYNVTVYTGQIYGYRLMGSVKIPTYFFKLIYFNQHYEAWLVPNINAVSPDYQSYTVNPNIIKEEIFKYNFETFN